MFDLFIDTISSIFPVFLSKADVSETQATVIVSFLSIIVISFRGLVKSFKAWDYIDFTIFGMVIVVSVYVTRFALTVS